MDYQQIDAVLKEYKIPHVWLARACFPHDPQRASRYQSKIGGWRRGVHPPPPLLFLIVELFQRLGKDQVRQLLTDIAGPARKPGSGGARPSKQNVDI
jgi:hypothetical protein